MGRGPIVFLFPGQGSQSPRMGRDFCDRFPSAGEVFARADELLGRDLSGLIFAGSARVLEQTENLQPAVTTVNAAILAVLIEHGFAPIAAAGHSLGEYSALLAADAASFDDVLPLVAARGEAMAAAAGVRAGGMVSVAGLDEEALEPVVARAGAAGVVCIANLNAPGQVVLSGEHDALELASRLAVEAGAARVVPLPVSGAWHSPLMEPASRAFAAHLDDARLDGAAIDVYANVTASAERDAGRLRELLGRQICAPVRWADSMRAMIAAHPDATFVEVGPGRVLMGLALRIDRRCRVRNVDTVAAFDKLVARLG